MYLKKQMDSRRRHTGKGGHALPAATQTYLPQAQRLQRDLGRQSVDLTAGLSALEAMQVAPAAIGVPEQEASEAHERARLEAVNLASALYTFQQLALDLSAGLDATQQIDAEVEHLLFQVLNDERNDGLAAGVEHNTRLSKKGGKSALVKTFEDQEGSFSF